MPEKLPVKAKKGLLSMLVPTAFNLRDLFSRRVDPPVVLDAQPSSDLTVSVDIENAFKNRTPLLGCVVARIKGGFSIALDVNTREDADAGLGMRAFLPTSLATIGQTGAAGPQLNDLVPFIVREYNQKTGSVIVSRREILQQEKKARAKLAWEHLKVGDTVSGVVKALLSYGAFVDVDGVDGFVHISDLSWDKHPRVENIVQMGEVLEFKIIGANPETHKLKLNRKDLVPDPWQSLEQKFPADAIVEGVVVALADFGAFVQLDDGVEGLIHLSEVSWQRVKHPSNRFHIGDKVTAKVMSVDPESRRISLSCKALEKSPVDKVAEKFPVGAVLKTTVSGTSDFGVFVDLDEGVRGLVHISELSWTEHIENPMERYHEGDQVEIVVIGYESEKQRVSCSMKRTQANPWPRWNELFARGTLHTATVKKVGNQGLDCELEPGLIAFCPSKELADPEGDADEKRLKVGSTVEVEVIRIEPDRFRITVSARARVKHEMQDAYKEYVKRQREEGGDKTTLADAISAHQRNTHG